MTKLKQNKLGFSLIELSILIIIIGLLATSAIAGRAIINSARTSSARNLTTNSPVNNIKNVVLWVETVSKNSFDNGAITGTSPKIATWRDISLKASPNNATQITLANQPTYIENAINGLPVLRFDGNSSFLNYDGTALAVSNYTIFVVEQRRSNKDNNYFTGADGTNANNTKLVLGYKTTSIITHAQFNNDYEIPSVVSSYSSPIPRIHSFRFSSSVGKDYSLNGVVKLNCIDNGTITECRRGLLSHLGANIGASKYSSYYFDGDIGEIIIFSKYLNDTDKADVEEYLRKKWGIKSN